MEYKPLKITDTILRDAHQSQAATRMKLEDMLPACEMLDDMGYWSIECWGGATFDSCMRFLNEDPWERLRALKKAMPKTPLQMLFRGQNILGYKHYADDVVDAFCRKSIENGIGVVRIFDALNDPRNLEQAMKCVNKYGKDNGCLCEAAISYTTSPVHSFDYFVDLAKTLEQMGADVIAIKDMANLLLPMDAYNLVKKLKETVSIPIHLHTHNTTGTGDMTNLMAAWAGVDIVDCALSPLGNGTSNPATESLVATLKGTERDTGLDLKKLSDAAAHFRKVAGHLDINPKVLKVDTNTLLYQVPGGMLSNLISQLKQLNAEDKYYEVLEEVPRVRADFGYPPLVTPTSQIVGTQAVLNVINGERYKMVTKESKGLLKGEYGKVPGEVNVEVRRKAGISDDEVITCRPADLLEPELEKYREESKGLARCEEDVLSYALFPQVATKFFEARNNPHKEEEKKEDEVRVVYVQDLSK